MTKGSMKLMGPTLLVKLTNHRAVMTGTLPTEIISDKIIQ